MEILTLDEIVGQSLTGDVYISDHIFNDNGRLGVVGSIYRPVYLEGYTSATSDEGLQRHLTRWWNDARRRGDQRGIGEFASDLYAEKGAGVIWDVGDPDKAARVRTYTCLSVTDVPIFTCCGGGMCISGRIGWARVADAGRLFRLLDVERGRPEAWDYFVKCGGVHTNVGA